jgi:hypothetical protein
MQAARYATFLFTFFLIIFNNKISAQDNQAVTQSKVKQLIEKKAEYHRLTNGERDGYRIKIHFGVDREAAKNVRTKFNLDFPDLVAYENYQQPYFVILVGDYNTKLDAYASWKKIKNSYPSAFIVKGKIKGN